MKPHDLVTRFVTAASRGEPMAAAPAAQATWNS